MSKLGRREFLELAAGLGGTAAFGPPFDAAAAAKNAAAKSAISTAEKLNVEVAEDEAFQHVVATASAPISADADWTCRVLVGGLKPAKLYWYRFTDADGNGSRVARTITAPAEADARPVRFAFISCQNANQGAQNAYRRMIFEDERAAENERLGFVLHLGDFIYEIVWYPEDRPQGMYDRRIREVGGYEHREKIRDF